ncbi:hypothetical protein N0V84_003581 [Fusarium piperis]|uniref:Uncharacterized protein n=1 Tax=Fusarium piperis TaxID=1435070 RepID=A0A9W8WH97_9HYPO|nr:hypothetical protein N0V84_003581 [Fusarium piperis]
MSDNAASQDPPIPVATASVTDDEPNTAPDEISQSGMPDTADREVHNEVTREIMMKFLSRQLRENLRRIEVFKKLGLCIQDLTFDYDTLLYSGRGVTEAQVQAMMEEMMTSTDGEVDVSS